jgi:hypothetical protein
VVYNRRETIEDWAADFCASPRFVDQPSLVREYAPRLLADFLERACAVRDVDPGEIEEKDLQPALLEGTARTELPASARADVPALLAAFLEELEAQGRLAGGRTLGLYVRAMKERYLDAASGRPRPITNPGSPIGRNDPCPCGSGLKYKKCCLGK